VAHERGAARSLIEDVPKHSEFGLKVARILDDIWALYNIPRQTKKADFSHGHRVEVLWDRDLETFDFDWLTQLVVRCHDECVRLSIGPCNMRYVRMMFHAREREGSTPERHPTMEQAVARIRSRNYFGATNRAVSPAVSAIDTDGSHSVDGRVESIKD
jgi:hypothetical protein